MTRDTDFTARIGWNFSHGGYFRDYQKAVSILFESITNGENTPDTVALPLLFLMRHSLELGYKFTLEEVSQHSGKSYRPGTRPGITHDLKACHKKLGQWFKDLKDQGNVPQELEEQFEKHYKLAESAMSKFDSLDPGSFNFRYVTNTNGVRNFSDNEIVDLSELKSAWEGALTLLWHTTDVFYPE